ncbi:MAG: hypothetical protein LBT60_04095 [Oscillospiraceae bacterium]|jgi:hypothetical protein|nr:hypothetical protein [Oscillospiraceae bacterium]
MEYFTPSQAGVSRRGTETAPAVPVNPSTVPGQFPLPPAVGRAARPAPTVTTPAVTAPELLPPADLSGETQAPPSTALMPLPPRGGPVIRPLLGPSSAFDEQMTGETPPSGSAYAMYPLPGDAPLPIASPLYGPGFLRGQIGRVIRVETLDGGALHSRIGRLIQVGADFLLLRCLDGNLLMCTLPATRFVTIVPGSELDL